MFGTQICVSDGVLAAAGSSLVVRPIREVHVKGRSHALIAYELMGIDGKDAEIAASEQDARLCRMTWDAWRQLQRGDVAKAAQTYRAILDAFPGDPVVRSQLETCDVPQEDAASA
jgi:hypothetical protein